MKICLMQVTFIWMKHIFSINFQVANANTSNHAQTSNEDNISKRNLKALKYLSVIVGLFILSWLLFLIYCVACVRNPAFCLKHKTVKIIHAGVSVLFRVNSVVNTIVYVMRFRGFNVAFRLMFGCATEDERQELMEIVTSVWCLGSNLEIEYEDNQWCRETTVKCFSCLVC